MKQEFLSEEEDISKEVLGITLSTMKAPQNIISETVSGISELYPNSTIVISMNDRAGPELWETANHVATQISDSVSVCVTTNTKYESSEIPPENIFRHTLEGDRSALIYLNGFQVCLRNPMIEKIVEIDLGGSMNWQQIPEFIKALDKTQIALSTRVMSSGGRMVNTPIQRRLLSQIGTTLSNVFLLWPKHNASDMTSGFEAFRANVVSDLFERISPEQWVCVQQNAGHLFQTEMRAYLYWLGYDISWIPITFGQNKAGKSITDIDYLYRNLVGLLMLMKRRNSDIFK